MCGRLTLKTLPSQWGQLLLPLVDNLNLPSDFVPRYNIAPTQSVYALASLPEQGRVLTQFRWGLVPGWAPDLAIGNSMINARHETLMEKRSFKSPLQSKRCLIIADGYYEWHRQSAKDKQAYWITPADGGLMLLAGLWESNSKATGQPITTCTIITTAANQRLTTIHDRMPVALVGTSAQQWLDSRCGGEAAYQLLGAADDEFLTPRAVSNFVNNARHEGEQCIVPLSE